MVELALCGSWLCWLILTLRRLLIPFYKEYKTKAWALRGRKMPFHFFCGYASKRVNICCVVVVVPSPFSITFPLSLSSSLLTFFLSRSFSPMNYVLLTKQHLDREPANQAVLMEDSQGCSEAATRCAKPTQRWAGTWHFFPHELVQAALPLGESPSSPIAYNCHSLKAGKDQSSQVHCYTGCNYGNTEATAMEHGHFFAMSIFYSYWKKMLLCGPADAAHLWHSSLLRNEGSGQGNVCIKPSLPPTHPQ